MIPSNVSRWTSLAAQHAVAPLLIPTILSIIWSESTGDPDAYNPGDPSWGLMGVSPLIARAFGHFPDSDTSWHTDPDKNLTCGCNYLGYLKQKYSVSHPLRLYDGSPNPQAWVGMYNAGETAILHGATDLPYVLAFIRHIAGQQ